MPHDRRREAATGVAAAALPEHKAEDALYVRNVVSAQADNGPIHKTFRYNCAIAQCDEQAATELRHVMPRTIANKLEPESRGSSQQSRERQLVVARKLPESAKAYKPNNTAKHRTRQRGGSATAQQPADAAASEAKHLRSTRDQRSANHPSETLRRE